MKCEDVTFEMADAEYGEPSYIARPGDLLWMPKGGDGHVLSDRTEKRDYGFVSVDVPLCECGGLDLEDHHVVLLARKP